MKGAKVKAAIHQPNFLPWLGFFDKIVQSDVFVILDHVINNPRDAIWTKRVQILCNGSPFWLTFPLKKHKGIPFVPINQMQVNKTETYQTKHLKTIELNYKKAPYYEEARPLLDSFYDCDSEFIAEKNISFIMKICECLGIKRDFIKSSELDCQFSSTEMLAEICRKVNANIYIYGTGADSYQENEILERQGIEVVARNFVHPVYKQFNSENFVKGFSIIDALMNCGIDGTKKLLNL